MDKIKLARDAYDKPENSGNYKGSFISGFLAGFDAAEKHFQTIVFDAHLDADKLHSENLGLKHKITELEQQLKDKAENGCCIVEHGWRMEAEHKVKTLEQQVKDYKEALNAQHALNNSAFEQLKKADEVIEFVGKARSGYVGHLLEENLHIARQYLKSRGE